MKKNVKSRSVSADEIVAKQKELSPSGNGLSSNQQEVKPSPGEMQEAHTPSLSTDFFKIGDKTFQFRLSNIKTQKLMAKAVDVLPELLESIDIEKIYLKFKDFVTKDDKGGEDQTVLDMVELAKVFIVEAGPSRTLSAIMDAYVAIVYAVCVTQDSTVTRDWIEENCSFNDVKNIFMIQMEKDQIGGKVINFLSVIARIVG